MVLRTIPVSVCVAITSTPGNTAPLWSLTVPLICAVACAHALPHEIAGINNAMNNTVNVRFIFPPKLHRCHRTCEYIKSMRNSPLLAVMQGGDCHARFQFIHTLYTASTVTPS